jgi:hypothetical protein
VFRVPILIILIVQNTNHFFTKIRKQRNKKKTVIKKIDLEKKIEKKGIDTV